MNNPFPVLRRRARLQILSTLACLAAGTAMAACASNAPYNPDGLATPQVSAVQQICQSVVGLSPREGSSGATLIPVNQHVTAGMTHYQGCVASLSDSLQSEAAQERTTQAYATCRARELASGSGALALCVLQRMRRPTLVTTTTTLQPAQDPLAQGAPRVSSSFFYATPKDVSRREQLACASLGLVPGTQQFGGCVEELRSTFFAIDNPIE